MFLNRSIPGSALALLVDEVLRCALDHAPTARALEVRRATPADIAGVARVHVASWQATYRGQVPEAVLAALDPVQRAAMWTERIAEPASDLFVAVRAGLVIGFAELLLARDADAAPATGEISAIYIDPLQLRTCAGRALFRVAFAVARQRGYRALTLWVLARNERALAFYRSEGFAADGAQKQVERRSYILHEVRQRREL